MGTASWLLTASAPGPRRPTREGAGDCAAAAAQPPRAHWTTDRGLPSSFCADRLRPGVRTAAQGPAAGTSGLGEDANAVPSPSGPVDTLDFRKKDSSSLGDPRLPAPAPAPWAGGSCVPAEAHFGCPQRKARGERKSGKALCAGHQVSPLLLWPPPPPRDPAFEPPLPGTRSGMCLGTLRSSRAGWR